MTAVDAAHTDPHRAVKGWIQDYWMLRLLDPRGLDLWGGGGPFDMEVGLRKGDARLTAFKNFAQRLALLGWVIVHRTDQNGSVTVAVPGHEWDTTAELEVSTIGGCGGVALGLPPILSKALFNAARATADSQADGESPEAPRKVPAYRSYTQLDTKVLQILEHMLTEHEADDVDLDELRTAAIAAAA